MLPARLAPFLAPLALLSGATRAAAQQPVYRDSTQTVEARVHDLLGRMSLEEKFWQLFMIPGSLDDSTNDYSHGVFGLQISMLPGSTARAHAERINAIQRFFVEHTRLGIPIIPFDEAVHGLMRTGATTFPQAIALAATWDTSLMGRVAEAIAQETGSRGIRQVLSPVVNIASDVRWGRVEETYGEDPRLASRMGDAFVSAFERAGIVATPKHFVANVGEGGRDSYPIDVSPRELAERFFPPFESAIHRAGARSVMTAYNSVDGAPATQSRWLLTDVLRRDWGFTGFVISDAAATGGATVLHLTEPSTPVAAKHALEAGLDVIFQSSWPQHRPYWEAFRTGMIADSVIDAAVARVLRAKFALGLFEHPYVDPDAAERLNGSDAHRALAREAAREGIVLLKNERGRLPLGRRTGSTLVVGADAANTAAQLGGYSGPGAHPISILDGLRARLGGSTVRFEPGPGHAVSDVVPVPADAFWHLSGGALAHGLPGDYWPNIAFAGAAAITRTDSMVDFRWTLNSPGRGIPFDWYSVRWTGRITAPAGGVRRIGVEGNDGWRLWIGGRLVLDNWRKQSARRLLADVTLQAGQSYHVRLEYFEPTGNARVKLVWNGGVTDSSGAAIDSAVAAARRADVAVIVAGVEEGEFRDRAILSLPGRQEELIEAVAATGTPVVVVLLGGSAITMSRWIDRVDAVVDAWYPGEAGEAVADVLTGEANPAGRLPVTFPVAEGQLPLRYNHKPTGRGDDYVDLTGQPLFPFGFGLSYTTFEYSALRIEPAVIGPDGSARVTCTVRNTGTRAGDEVVQLYLRDVLASVARPVMELRGFRRVRLEAGQATDVSFNLGPEELRMLDRELRWVVEPGTFRVMVGASSRDIRLRGELDVR